MPRIRFPSTTTTSTGPESGIRFPVAGPATRRPVPEYGIRFPEPGPSRNR